jgi:hypothetical protein
MTKILPAAVLCLALLGSGAARAEECGEHCDYQHNYGPYDFSYIQPGLLGYPICDREGNCSPHLAYTYPGRRYGRITIRSVSRPARRTGE